jgi:hypothetical protein
MSRYKYEIDITMRKDNNRRTVRLSLLANDDDDASLQVQSYIRECVQSGWKIVGTELTFKDPVH